MGQTAEPVIGRIGSQGQGVFGIEYQYQNVLEGKDGKEVRSVAANGLPIPGAPISYVAPKPGSSITLTIDPALQYYAEQALAGEIQSTRALGGTAVVMDVATGQILAMASLMAPAPTGALWPWLAVIGVLSGLELVAYLVGGSDRHAWPTLSALYDGASAHEWAKGVFAALWLAMGWGLFRR
jgi:hypothetical protein